MRHMEPGVIHAHAPNDRAIKGNGTPEATWRNSGRLSSLPEVDPAILVPLGARAVIVSPHPDDEILGSGGLLAQLSDLGRKVLIIAVTDGTASHPDSPEWPTVRLAATRSQETRDALQRLRMKHVALERLHLPDGGGETFESELAEALKARLEPDDI